MTTKDIQGYEGLYTIGQDGVSSLPRPGSKGGILKPFVARKGNAQLCVGLWKNNIKTQFSVKLLIAKHFISNPDGHKYIRCKDGDEENLNLNNLEWAEYDDTIHSPIKKQH